MQTPVCVTVMDTAVEEVYLSINGCSSTLKYLFQVCEDLTPDIECFQPSCTNITRPRFEKKCREIFDEKCEVIIEQATVEQCTEVEQIEYEEQCTTVNEQQCSTVQEYKCEQQKSPPAQDSYGVPQVCWLVVYYTIHISTCGFKLHLVHIIK